MALRYAHVVPELESHPLATSVFYVLVDEPQCSKHTRVHVCGYCFNEAHCVILSRRHNAITYARFGCHHTSLSPSLHHCCIRHTDHTHRSLLNTHNMSGFNEFPANPAAKAGVSRETINHKRQRVIGNSYHCSTKCASVFLISTNEIYVYIGRGKYT